MNFDVMRRKLLERALSGRLVPQLDDEPKVEQVGEALGDQPFKIPEKWKWVQLTAIGKIVGGGTPKTNIETYWQGGTINWFTPADLGEIKGKFARESSRKITQGGLRESSAKLMPAGSVLFSSRAPIGHIAISTTECCTNQGCKSFVPDFDKISTDWGYYAIHGLTEEIKSRASGTTFKEISTKEMGKTWIPLPPIEEQNRIVAKLTKILEIIDKAERAYSDLTGPLSNRFRSLCIERALKGELVPQLESESPVEPIGGTPEDIPFSIPDKWKWTRIQDVATLNPKITTHDESLKVSFAPMASVDAGYINRINTSDERSWSSVKTGYAKFAEDDILLAKITPCFQNRKSAIATNLKNGIGCGSTEFHVLRASKEVDKEYLLMFLKSQWFIEYGVENFKGTAGQQRLGTADLKSCPFPLPPLKEQRRIVEKLYALFKDLDRLTG